MATKGDNQNFADFVSKLNLARDLFEEALAHAEAIKDKDLAVMVATVLDKFMDRVNGAPKPVLNCRVPETIELYPKAWVESVLKIWPDATVTQIGPRICAMRVVTGKGTQRIVSWYNVRTGKWLTDIT